MNSFFVVSVFGFGFLILSNTISDRIGKGGLKYLIRHGMLKSIKEDSILAFFRSYLNVMKINAK